MKNVRRIAMEGSNNCRDLGGFFTKDGYSTVWNKLYRTDGLMFLTSDDWRILRETGIRTLIDLRGEKEQTDNPIRCPDGFKYIKLPFLSTDAIKRESLESSLTEKYSSQFFRSLDNVAQIMNTLNSVIDHGAAAFFCSAGKDRTGMLTATALTLCGVPDDDIIADYMVTEIYDSNHEKGIFDKLKASMSAEKFDSLKALFESKPATIAELLEAFKERDMRQALNDHGFSFEAQAEFARKMKE